MLNNTRRRAAALLSCLVAGALCPISRASIGIMIDNVNVTAGSTAHVGFYAYKDATGDPANQIAGFNLPIDIKLFGSNSFNGFVDGNADNISDLPTGFSYSPAPALSATTSQNFVGVQNAVYSNTAFDLTFPQIQFAGLDGIADGSGSPTLTLTATPTKLFELSINVNASVATGTKLLLQLDTGTFFNVADVGGNPVAVTAPAAGAPVIGSITVVPEPSTAAILLIPAAGLLRRRRQARNR